MAEDFSFLDPEDWDRFRAQAHELLDVGLDRMQRAGHHPWTPVPDDLPQRYSLETRSENIVEKLWSDVLPHHGGNTHPRFWGWVQGTGLASDVLASIAGAVMNGNLGGRDHGAVYMEREIIDWTRRQMGFPEQSSGVLVSGTSQATVISFAAARVRALSNVRNTGQGDVKLTAYAGQGVHNATRKALELLGIGADNLRHVPLQDGQMDAHALRDIIGQDRADGTTPFLVVGTAGSVDLGLFDNLPALADVAEQEHLWLHVDGAFGAWTRLADAPWHGLTNGIERADSLALDFHKWMYVGYDCGLALIRNRDEHRAAFAARPSYLEGAESGLAGGDPWFCDYGIDLSRGNRALRIWCALQMLGREAFAKAITRNCRQAQLMAQEVQNHPNMQVGAKPTSCICTFTARADLPAETQSALNSKIAQDMQNAGEAVFSTTKVNGVTMLRAAITNHRTQDSDIRDAIAKVAQRAANG